MRRAMMIGLGILVSAAIVVWLISCGGGGGGGGWRGQVGLNVGSQGQDIALTADATLSVAFTVQYDVARHHGPFGGVSLNLNDNLAGLSFTPEIPPDGLSVGTEPLLVPGGTMWLRIALSEAIDTVCDEGELYGPFALAFNDLYQPQSFEPASARTTTTTMNIINTGAYSVCVQVVVPVNAVVDFNRVEFEVALCDEAPAAIAGTWTGTYSCSSNCYAESGDVTMWITQDSEDPSIASYTDEGGALYEGTVCGSRFSYRGGKAGQYEESGTFVMDPGGTTATKTSTYRTTPSGTCWGDCSDTLVRVD